jgi:hypothetical protein
MTTRDNGTTPTVSDCGVDPQAKETKALAYTIYLAYARWMLFEDPQTVARILQKYGHRDSQVRTWLGERTPPAQKGDRYLTDLEVEFLLTRAAGGKRAKAKTIGAGK